MNIVQTLREGSINTNTLTSSKLYFCLEMQMEENRENQNIVILIIIQNKTSIHG